MSCDWDNAQWMSRYTPRDICLCEEHAKEFIDATLDKEAYDRWIKEKQEYDEREKVHEQPLLCCHCDDGQRGLGLINLQDRYGNHGHGKNPPKIVFNPVFP